MKNKKLKDYRDELKKLNLLEWDNKDTADFDIEVKDISYNSLTVKPGTLFICKGANFKQEYLADALKRGACGYVSDRNMGLNPNIPVLAVNDLRTAISKISAKYFDKSWDEHLKIIGLTGTKGKSTTVTMIKSIMDIYCGREIGFSSGIYTYDGVRKEKARKLTTPETIELHRILNSCVENGCGYLTMEVSSQALKYGRTADLRYEICGFLNISEDHISAAEHSDMEDYFSSKLKIFDSSKIACINLDMDKKYLTRVLQTAGDKCSKVITYGFGQIEKHNSLLHSSHIQGISVTETAGAILVKALIDGTEEEFYVNIGGAYNGYNALAAIAITHELGVPLEIIKKGLQTVKVAGRMELYTLPGEKVDVIVDCAHNKMSYEALFNYVHHHYPTRKVGFLFGCVGDKAFNRRKEAGEIADKNADFIVITERDPGKEDVNKICDDIMANIEHKEKAVIITDRDKAVREALLKAESMGNCILILAGCGSDAYVKRGTTFVEFATDGERVQEFIGEQRKNK